MYRRCGNAVDAQAFLICTGAFSARPTPGLATLLWRVVRGAPARRPLHSGERGCMADETTDRGVLRHIEHLVHEEQKLYGSEQLDDHGQVRLEAIKVELDQCWDLLRQRRALRDAGQDPDRA